MTSTGTLFAVVGFGLHSLFYTQALFKIGLANVGQCAEITPCKLTPAKLRSHFDTDAWQGRRKLHSRFELFQCSAFEKIRFGLAPFIRD
jgi:hypothetical protein